MEANSETPERPTLIDDLFHCLASHLTLKELCVLLDVIPVMRRDVVPHIWSKAYPLNYAHFGSLSKFKVFVLKTERQLREGTPGPLGVHLCRMTLKHYSKGCGELGRLAVDMDPDLDSRAFAMVLTNAMREETTLCLSNYTLFVRELAPLLRAKGKWDSEVIWIAIAEWMAKNLWQFERDAELGNLAKRVGLSEVEIATIAGSLNGAYYDDVFDSRARVLSFTNIALGRTSKPDGRILQLGF